MTEDDIKQMIADREAGTPGSWHITSCADYWVQSGELGIAHCGDIEWIGSEGVVSSQSEMQANARRIARVPYLEAEVLRLRQALKIIAGYSQCIDNLMGNVDVAREALEGKRNGR